MILFLMISCLGIFIYINVSRDENNKTRPQNVEAEVQLEEDSENKETAKEQTNIVESASLTEEKPDNNNDGISSSDKDISDEKNPVSQNEAEEYLSKTREERPEKSDVTLLFGGDVYFSDHVMSAYENAGGISGVLDENIRNEIENADIFMVNEEFPFTNRGTPAADKQFTFRISPDKVKILKEMGVDIVTLANNHILDYGEEGLLDSISVLREAGIPYVGAGKNLEEAKGLKIIECGGRKIGFLGCSRVYMDASWAAGANHPGVFSTYDPAPVLESIRSGKKVCDYLVVYVHWGVERETEPKEYQREMGHAYVDAGADLVVGAHPHVLQEVEEYNGKIIAYSLGNFVFGSSIPSTELLKINLSGEENTAVMELLPCSSSAGFTKRKDS